MTNSPLESLKEIDGKWYYFHKNFKKGEKKGLAYLKFRIQRPLIKFHSKVYNFFNPKAGLTFELSQKNQLYASYGRAQREPNRNDFENGITKPEKLDEIFPIENF